MSTLRGMRPETTTAVAAYLKEVRRHPLPTPEEQLALAVQYKETGDVAIARKLATGNLRLVVKIANEFRRAHHNLLDLIQEGNLGLMRAIEKYDPTRGVKLSSYATWWIRAFILRFIVDNTRIVKIGSSPVQRKLYFNLRKEQQKLEEQGFEVTPAALAAAMQVPVRDVVDMDQRLSNEELSLDAPLHVDPTSDDRPDELVEGVEFRAALHDKIAAFGQTLDGRERQIFDERLLSQAPKTLVELGNTFHISRERTRQLEAALLDKLKRYLMRELGEAVPANDYAKKTRSAA